MATPRLGGNQPSNIADVPRPLRWTSLDTGLKIRRGIVQGATAKDFFARSLSPISTGAWEDLVWDDVTRLPVESVLTTSSLNLVVRSDDVADAPAGTGARIVTIIGVGPGGDPVSDDFEAPFQSENINLNASQNQVTAKQYFGGQILEAKLVNAGTNRVNQGTVTVRRTGNDGGAIVLEIPPGHGSAMVDHMVVPLGWVCVVREVVVFWPGDTQANWRLRVLTPQGTLQSPMGGSVSNGDIPVPLHGGRIIEGESTFWFQALRDQGGAVGAHMSIYASLEFFLISDIVQPPLEPVL